MINIALYFVHTQPGEAVLKLRHLGGHQICTRKAEATQNATLSIVKVMV